MSDKSKNAAAIWLEDTYARLMVGAKPRKQDEPVSRWASQDTIVEEIGVGFWFSADTIQEFAR